MRLVVFAGLPGSGKTTLARTVADRLNCTFLRIDTIEAAIASTFRPFEGNPVGYVATEWVAEEQLRSGRDVVIDAANTIEVARRGWVAFAERTGARLHLVEVVCSDPVEHRRRVESRRADWPGQGVPTWAQVQARRWEPFTMRRQRIDNRGEPARHVEAVLAAVRGTTG